jgi:uncharacterized RDD family membrane protein YckC
MSPVGGEGTGEQSSLMGDRVETRADEIGTSVSAAPYDVMIRSLRFLPLVADDFFY